MTTSFPIAIDPIEPVIHRELLSLLIDNPGVHVRVAAVHVVLRVAYLLAAVGFDFVQIRLAKGVR